MALKELEGIPGRFLNHLPLGSLRKPQLPGILRGQRDCGSQETQQPEFWCQMGPAWVGILALPFMNVWLWES